MLCAWHFPWYQYQFVLFSLFFLLTLAQVHLNSKFALGLKMLTFIKTYTSCFNALSTHLLKMDPETRSPFKVLLLGKSFVSSQSNRCKNRHCRCAVDHCIVIYKVLLWNREVPSISIQSAVKLAEGSGVYKNAFGTDHFKLADSTELGSGFWN